MDLDALADSLLEGQPLPATPKASPPPTSKKASLGYKWSKEPWYEPVMQEWEKAGFDRRAIEHNINRESGGKPRIQGDNGKSHGLYQFYEGGVLGDLIQKYGRQRALEIARDPIQSTREMVRRALAAKAHEGKDWKEQAYRFTRDVERPAKKHVETVRRELLQGSYPAADPQVQRNLSAQRSARAAQDPNLDALADQLLAGGELAPFPGVAGAADGSTPATSDALAEQLLSPPQIPMGPVRPVAPPVLPKSPEQLRAAEQDYSQKATYGVKLRSEIVKAQGAIKELERQLAAHPDPKTHANYVQLLASNNAKISELNQIAEQLVATEQGFKNLHTGAPVGVALQRAREELQNRKRNPKGPYKENAGQVEARVDYLQQLQKFMSGRKLPAKALNEKFQLQDPKAQEDFRNFYEKHLQTLVKKPPLWMEMAQGALGLVAPFTATSVAANTPENRAIHDRIQKQAELRFAKTKPPVSASEAAAEVARLRDYENARVSGGAGKMPRPQTPLLDWERRKQAFIDQQMKAERAITPRPLGVAIAADVVTWAAVGKIASGVQLGARAAATKLAPNVMAELGGQAALRQGAGAFLKRELVKMGLHAPAQGTGLATFGAAARVAEGREEEIPSTFLREAAVGTAGFAVGGTPGRLLQNRAVALSRAGNAAAASRVVFGAHLMESMGGLATTGVGNDLLAGERSLGKILQHAGTNMGVALALGGLGLAKANGFKVLERVHRRWAKNAVDKPSEPFMDPETGELTHPAIEPKAIGFVKGAAALGKLHPDLKMADALATGETIMVPPPKQRNPKFYVEHDLQNLDLEQARANYGLMEKAVAEGRPIRPGDLLKIEEHIAKLEGRWRFIETDRNLASEPEPSSQSYLSNLDVGGGLVPRPPQPRSEVPIRPIEPYERVTPEPARPEAPAKAPGKGPLELVQEPVVAKKAVAPPPEVAKTAKTTPRAPRFVAPVPLTDDQRQSMADTNRKLQAGMLGGMRRVQQYQSPEGTIYNEYRLTQGPRAGETVFFETNPQGKDRRIEALPEGLTPFRQYDAEGQLKGTRPVTKLTAGQVLYDPLAESHVRLVAPTAGEQWEVEILDGGNMRRGLKVGSHARLDVKELTGRWRQEIPVKQAQTPKATTTTATAATKPKTATVAAAPTVEVTAPVAAVATQRGKTTSTQTQQLYGGEEQFVQMTPEEFRKLPVSRALPPEHVLRTDFGKATPESLQRFSEADLRLASDFLGSKKGVGKSALIANVIQAARLQRVLAGKSAADLAKNKVETLAAWQQAIGMRTKGTKAARAAALIAWRDAQKPELTQKLADVRHRALVEKALKSGKTISPKVLAAYPDLAAKLGEPKSQAAPTTRPDYIESDRLRDLDQPWLLDLKEKNPQRYQEEVTKIEKRAQLRREHDQKHPRKAPVKTASKAAATKTPAQTQQKAREVEFGGEKRQLTEPQSKQWDEIEQRRVEAAQPWLMKISNKDKKGSAAAKLELAKIEERARQEREELLAVGAAEDLNSFLAELDPNYSLSNKAFYSALEEAALRLPEKTTPAQIKKFLQANGAKQVEIDYIGLDGFLDAQEGRSLTREDVLDFINENYIDLLTVQLPDQTWGLEAEHALQARKFDGRNYEEWALLLKTPLHKRDDLGFSTPPDPGHLSETHRLLGGGAGGAGLNNQLFMARTSEFMSEAGERTFLLDELQSDWAKRARHVGVRKLGISGMIPEGMSIKKDKWAGYQLVGKDGNVVLDLGPNKSNAHQKAIRWIDKNLPVEGPYEFWHQQALKFFLNHAAHAIYDRLAWSTGEQIQERWSVGERVGGITYNADTKTLKLWTEGGYGPGSGMLIREITAKTSELDQHLPKRVVDELLRQKTYEVTGEGEVQALELADEEQYRERDWPVGLYGSIPGSHEKQVAEWEIPEVTDYGMFGRFMQGYLKKRGWGEVETTLLKASDGKRYPVFSVKITEAMRQPNPLYMRSGTEQALAPQWRSSHLMEITQNLGSAGLLLEPEELLDSSEVRALSVNPAYRMLNDRYQAVVKEVALEMGPEYHTALRDAGFLMAPLHGTTEIYGLNIPHLYGKELKGRVLVDPVRGLFSRAKGGSEWSPLEWAMDLVETLVHELTHNKIRHEGPEFLAELDDQLAKLKEQGVLAKSALKLAQAVSRKGLEGDQNGYQSEFNEIRALYAGRFTRRDRRGTANPAAVAGDGAVGQSTGDLGRTDVSAAGVGTERSRREDLRARTDAALQRLRDVKASGRLTAAYHQFARGLIRAGYSDYTRWDRAMSNQLAWWSDLPGQVRWRAFSQSYRVVEKQPRYSTFSPAPPFYSQVFKVAQQVIPEKGVTAERLKQLLDPSKGLGIKTEELYYLGLFEHFAGTPSVIPKQAILDYLSAHNLSVQEVVKSRKPTHSPDWEAVWEEVDLSETGKHWLREKYVHSTDGYEKVLRLWRETKASEMTLREDGLTNYNESIQIPKLSITETKYQAADDPVYLVWEESADSRHPIYHNYRKTLHDAKRFAQDRISAKKPAFVDSTRWHHTSYTSEELVLRGDEEYHELLFIWDPMQAPGGVSKELRKDWEHHGHWSENNVVAHVRFTTRTTTSGKKMVFIEEVQSDLHEAANSALRQGKPAYLTAKEEQEAKERGYRIDAPEQGARYFPDFPFKQNYHELALKRVVHWAAERDYDLVGWTAAEQQNERYGKTSFSHEAQLIERPDGKWMFNWFYPEVDTWSQHEIKGPEELTQYLDGLIANKLLNAPVEETFVGKVRTFRDVHLGFNVKVFQGEKGMRVFYDEKLPKFAAKWGKQFGADLGKETFVTRPENVGYELVGRYLDEAGVEYLGTWATEEAARQEMQLLKRTGEFDPSDFEIIFRPDNGYVKGAETVWSLELTPKFKQVALTEGFPQFHQKQQPELPPNFSLSDEHEATIAALGLEAIPEGLDAEARKVAKDGLNAQFKGLLSNRHLRHLLYDIGVEILQEQPIYEFRAFNQQMAPLFPWWSQVHQVHRKRFFTQLLTHLGQMQSGTRRGQEPVPVQVGRVPDTPLEEFVQNVFGGLTRSFAPVSSGGLEAKTGAAVLRYRISELARKGAMAYEEFAKEGQYKNPSHLKSLTAGQIKEGWSKFDTARGVFEKLPTEETRQIIDDIEHGRPVYMTEEQLEEWEAAEERYAEARQAVIELEKQAGKVNAAAMRAALDEEEAALEARELLRTQIHSAVRERLGERDPRHHTQEIVDSIRTLLDERRDHLQRLGGLRGYYEHYFPHIWEDPSRAEKVFEQMMSQKLAQTVGRSPLRGPGSFRKSRSYLTVKDGLDAGLRPLAENPVDLLLLKIREIDRWIMARQAIEDLKGLGLAEYARGTKGNPPNAGWTVPKDAAFLVYGTGESGERIVRGRYYLPERVTLLIDNYLSPGLNNLWGVKAYRGWADLLNGAQLSLSGFHFMFVSLDSAMSMIAQSLDDVLGRGKPLRAARRMGTTFINPGTVLGAGIGSLGGPLSAILAGTLGGAGWKLYHLGKGVEQEYMKPGTGSLDDVATVTQLEEAGGRIHMDPYYKHSNVIDRAKLRRRIVDDFKSKGVRAVVPALGHGAKISYGSAFAMLEYVNSWLMEKYIPRLKMGLFAELAAQQMADLQKRVNDGEIIDDTVRMRMLQDLWSSVDNRLGHLVYDNSFWNKMGKDLGFASLRSVGWNVGGIRETVGGIYDLAEATTRPVRDRLPKREWKPPYPGAVPPPEVPDRYQMPRLSAMGQRGWYVLSMALVIASIGYIANMLWRKKPPESWVDYFYWPTGKMLPSGKPERVMAPSYIKDWFAWTHNPLETLSHKLNPGAGMLGELYKNSDFYGREIVDKDAPKPTQIQQALVHVLEGYIPIAPKNFERKNEQRGVLRRGVSRFWPQGPEEWRLMAETEFGLTPAPRWVDQTKAEKKMEEYIQRGRSVGPEAQEVFDDRKVTSVTTRYLREHKAGIPPQLWKEINEAGINRPVITKMIKRGMQPPSVVQFNTLTLPEAIRVIRLANEEERSDWLPILMRKMRTARTRGSLPTGSDLQRLLKEYLKATAPPQK